MPAFAEPPAHARPPATPPGSRWETARLLLQLATDLLSTPFHLVAFALRRARHRRRFRDALEESTR